MCRSVAVCRSVVQGVAECWSVLQRVADGVALGGYCVSDAAACCGVLQRAVVC